MQTVILSNNCVFLYTRAFQYQWLEETADKPILEILST